jgi:CRISPR/Cas system CSM-associated protein Csm3 (group 7 of RAMP superfamily)
VTDDRYTVIAVDDETVSVMPHGDGWGGSIVDIPRQMVDGADITIGSQVSGWILVEGEDVIAEMAVTPGASATKVKVRRRGDGWAHGQTTIPSLAGVDSDQERAWATQCGYWLGDEVRHFHDLRGHLQAKRAEADEQARQAAEVREQHQQRQWVSNRTDYRPDTFVNPYAFVPLPDGAPERTRPAGHLRREPGRLHGRLTVRGSALTPLLLRSEKPEPGQPSALPRQGGQPVAPGSTVKGSLRSIVETLTGSCLRIVDTGFIPAYRDVLRASNRAGWVLVSVTETREGRPTKVRRATNPAWVAFPLLAEALGSDGVRTGATVAVPGTARAVGTGPGARMELREPGSVTAGTTHVVLVTDTSARSGKKGTTFVVGELQTEQTVTVDEGGWRRFEAALDGSDDFRTGRVGDRSRQELVPVDATIDSTKPRPASTRAYRQRMGYLDDQGVLRAGVAPGQVLWARMDGTKVTDLAYAHTWRHGDAGPTLGERLGPYAPCDDIDDACPACRVFGLAPTRASTTREPPQPYAGHVIVRDWTVTGSTSIVDLPPSGSPRPGSGQMYLENPPDAGPRAHDGQVPLREWASALDTPRRRPAGRKMYWRTSDQRQRPRWQRDPRPRREGNAGTMLASAEVVDAGATIDGTVIFENLTTAELGALVAALQPGRLAPHRHEARTSNDPTGSDRSTQGTYCFSIGGGKHLGLGSVAVTDVSVTLDPDGGGRYRGEPSRQLAEEDLDQMVTALVSLTPDHVKATWPDLLEMLLLDAVNPATVGYPRTKAWPDDASAAVTDDASELGAFEWWTRTAGMPSDGLASKDPERLAEHAFVSLPRPTAQDPSMTIDPRDAS